MKLSEEMSTPTKSIKRNKELPSPFVSIEIYTGIARFPCCSTAFLTAENVFNLYTECTCTLYMTNGQWRVLSYALQLLVITILFTEREQNYF